MPPSLDAAELTARIARATGASEVTLGRRVQQLWGGYGELLRAKLTLGSGSSSVIVKLVQPPLDRADVGHRRKLRSYAVERAFYRRYAERCLELPGCRVPRALGSSAEGSGWLFVLEDLDASGFSERSARPSPQRISATLRWLASFHARFLGESPDELWPTGTYWHLTTRREELSVMRPSALREAAPRIDRALEAARFKTFVHGDAKLENVCFGADPDPVAMVDFQYVGGGVGVKDVAYFLSSCLAPRECEARVPGYVDQYFQELFAAVQERAAGVDFGALEREWRALFPLAWVDYYRFLLGWAPGRFEDEPYSERLTRGVLASFTSA